VVTDQLVRALDDRVRRLMLVAKPLTRPLLWGNSAPRTRHRLDLYGATAIQSRRLASAVRRTKRTATAGPAQASGALARAARQITQTPVGRQQPAAAQPLALADTLLFARCSTVPGGRANDPVIQPLIRLRYLLREIAEPGTSTHLDAIQPAIAERAVLTGFVVGETGAPVRDGVVLLFDRDHHQAARERVGADGSYLVEAPSDSYIVTVTAPGRQPIARRMNLPLGVTTTNPVLLPLSQKAVVSGQQP
jgi:hypothetical protein